MNLLGKTIKEYEIQSFINEGGFGAVYRATKNGENYAIKVFEEKYVLREFKKHGGDDNRLKREIKIMESFKHKNLVEYVDDFEIEDETGKQFFLVMEYIDGGNLRDILEEREKLSEDESINIFKQVASAIEYLHNSEGEEDDRGVIHRDLKPENILVKSDGTVKVVDFGISKVIDFTSLTSTGEVFGTGPYMSPEQITDSKNIDKRSDLYALGVILYEMLTGYHPYDFQHIHELIEKIKFEPAIPLRRRNSEITNKIENIVLRLLEKNPYQRFNKISDIIKSIENTNGEIEAKIYDLSPRFVLRLYNDKSVVENFSKRDSSFGGVVFPANLESNQPGLKKKIQEDPNINIIVDPATVRLAYSTYAETKGVRELPYAPSDYSIITPDSLKHYSDQKKYVQSVLEKQLELGADQLLTPFHYIHNSSVGYGPEINATAEWFDLDCKLAKESIDYRNENCPDKEIYMGICVRADSLSNERTKKHLLNVFSSIEGDGFLIYGDCIDNNTNEVTLFNYIDFLLQLQTWTQKPVIAGRINAGLGMGLLCFGLTGFTSGTARFESFYEDLYSESSDAYNMYVRYYFPEILSTVPIKRSVPTKFQQITGIIGSCNCHYCAGKEESEVRKDQNAHLHFLEIIYKEIEYIKSLAPHLRRHHFLNKIEEAKNNYTNLQAVGFKPTDSVFLKRWERVFGSIQEKYKNV